ncbi:hypothetical protein [Actinomadura rubrobrunea]|nr:hypothetical protein [Actinomadura rubrobrunea]
MTRLDVRRTVCADSELDPAAQRELGFPACLGGSACESERRP